MEFEWNESKAATNERKHGVTFHEAATVFGDPLSVTFDDPDHSEAENRRLTFGISATRRHIVVAHTNRGSRIRIICARLMTKRERNIYEES
jgi:uncharacterized DUF497 family protein